jgi:hypothetical protein
MPEPVLDLEFKTFGGINLKDNPGRLPLTETDRALNVWGDGQRVAKAPGIRILAKSFPTGSVDVTGLCEYKLDTGSHVLVVAYHADTGRDKIATLSLDLGVLNDLGSPASFVLGAGYPGSIVATLTTGADAGYLVWSGGWLKLGTAPAYAYKDFGAGVPVPAWCLFATHFAWFSNVLFASGGAIAFSRVAFSQSERPEIQETANDFFPTNAEGSLSPVVGLKRAGQDSLYVMKPQSIERITGSAREYFQKSTVINGVGGYSEAAWTDCYGTLIGFTARRGPAAAASTTFPMVPDDIAVLAGEKYASIGYKVSPRLAGLAPTTYASAIAAFWRKNNLALLAPHAPAYYDGTVNHAANADVTVLAYNLRSESWWEWTVPSALACTAMASVPMTIGGVAADRIVMGLRSPGGTNPAMLTYFDEDYATHSGAPFPSYWESAWIDFGKGRRQTAEQVCVRGYQQSGGMAKFSIAIDRDITTMKEVAEFDLNEDGAVFGVPNGDLGINASRWGKYRIDFPPDGVRSEFNYVGIWRKDRGPVKDSTVSA